MVLSRLGKGVTCKWSFVPTAECCLRMLLLAAPTSGGTWNSLLPVGGLQAVLHGGSQEARRAPWKVQGGISHKSGS